MVSKVGDHWRTMLPPQCKWFRQIWPKDVLWKCFSVWHESCVLLAVKYLGKTRVKGLRLLWMYSQCSGSLNQNLPSLLGLMILKAFHPCVVGIGLKDEDKQKTAFSTDKGHFHFNRLPFGIKNAPAAFQRAMFAVLAGLEDIRALVYLDDLIIHGENLNEHLGRPEKLFAALSCLLAKKKKVHLQFRR